MPEHMPFRPASQARQGARLAQPIRISLVFNDFQVKIEPPLPTTLGFYELRPTANAGSDLHSTRPVRAERSITASTLTVAIRKPESLRHQAQARILPPRHDRAPE